MALSDAGSYRCVLGVRDPGGREMLFKQTETVDLTLIVYRKWIAISHSLFTSSTVEPLIKNPSLEKTSV